MLTFPLAPVPTRSQEAATSPSASTAESVKYPNTKAGLQQFLSDIREAARANELRKLAVLVKGTEIPDCDAWLHAMYEPDKADSWMGLCDAKTLRSNEKSLEAQFTDLAKVDGEFVMRKVNDDPKPGHGMEWGWLQAIRQPLDIYFASWKSAEGATSEPIGYFMFISGGGASPRSYSTISRKVWGLSLRNLSARLKRGDRMAPANGCGWSSIKSKTLKLNRTQSTEFQYGYHTTAHLHQRPTKSSLVALSDV